MAIIQTDAVLLKKFELRETSLILSLFTRDHGMIKGVIKGVRSPQPQFGALFELFSLDRVVYYENRKKELYIISKCELVEYYQGLRTSLEGMAYASYYAELVEHTCQPGQPSLDVFELLVTSLKDLSSGRVSGASARIFEIKLLKSLGMMPRLKACVKCGCDIADGRPRISVSNGGALCQECVGFDITAAAISPGAALFIETVAQTPVDMLSRLKLSAELAAELKRFFGIFLDFHIQNAFKSVEFMKQIGVY